MVEDVGGELGLKHYELDFVLYDNRHSIVEAGLAMLHKWRPQVASDAEAWRHLWGALHRAGLEHVAREVLEKSRDK